MSNNGVEKLHGVADITVDIILSEVMALVENKKNQKKEMINDLLQKYSIDMSFDDHIILVTFVYLNDYIGTRACIELGGNPQLIMDNDSICKMDELQKIRMDGLFRSFGYECEWVDCDIEDLDIRDKSDYDSPWESG